MKILVCINFVWLLALTIFVLDLKSSWESLAKAVTNLQDVALDYLRSSVGEKLKKTLGEIFEEKLKKEYKDESKSEV